jgi:hypothetical protein
MIRPTDGPVSLVARPPGLRAARILLGACLLLVAGQAGAAPDSPKLRIPRVSAPPRLDDFVAGRIPSDMARVTEFVQREPRDGEPVSRETTAFVGYDQASLYVVFLCKEDKGVVRARMAKRESIMGDDNVAVFLDTFNDHRHAYGFSANALGIQMDSLVTDGQDDDYSFDTLWYSEGRLTADGYAVRLAIPFRSLRFASSNLQSWGIVFVRFLPTRNEISFWPRVTKNISNQIAQGADADGLEGISPGRNMQFIPYGAFTGSRFLNEDAGIYGEKNEGRAGVDAKVVIKDALTLDVAANPDFSQVESDEPQVTINQRFEVQFPEKRPFFIENSSYFKTPEELFFSRRIVDPSFGARLTGRVGAWTVAGLVMDDRAPGEQALPSSGLQDKATVAAVGRVVREFARQSTIGAMFTSRDFGASSNRVAAADVRLRFGDNWIVSGQAIASRTTHQDGGTQSGPAFVAGASYDSRSLELQSQYTDRSEGFESELGFFRRTDIRQWENGIQYTWFPKDSPVLSWGPAFESSVVWNQAGELQDWEAGPEVEVEFPASTQVHLGAGRGYELYEGVGFDKYSARVFAETEWLKWLSGMFGYSQGPEINYYPAQGLPFLADGLELEAGFTLRPTPRMRIEGTYIYNVLSTGSDRPAGVAEGESIFRLHLFRTKANYQFTRELSLRAIVDYNVLNPNSALVDLERDKRLTGDLLVTYLLNPGTAVYVGYTGAYANLVIDPRLPASRQRTDSPRTLTGRQFFVKVSYLLRY